MDKLRDKLAPLLDVLPEPYRGYLPDEGWLLAYLVVALAAILLVGWVLRAMLRTVRSAVLGRRREEWDTGLHEDLSQLPPVNGSPSLCVYHIPAWVKLIILAPMGKSVRFAPQELPFLLDRVVPGLGTVLLEDLPKVVLWPAPLSAMGFANAFHRCTPTGRTPEEATGWVMLAGKAQGGGQGVFLGLALWTSEPTTLGRRNLEPEEWLQVLRLQSIER
jgi:hypothetical protein